MWKRLKRIIKEIRDITRRPEMQVLPGQIAFFIVLAVVPILTLTTITITSFNLPINIFSDFFEKVFSKEIVLAITPVISGNKLDLPFFGFLLVGFYIASNGPKSIINASDMIYGIKKNDNVKKRIKAILMTIVMVFLFIFILIVPVFGNKIVDLLKYVEVDNNLIKITEAVFTILKGPITWFVIFIFIKILYTMAPDKKIGSASVTKGSIFTSILWVLITYIYSYYVSNFARYDLLYAGLSSIVILMLWLYFLAYVFVIGLAINANSKRDINKD